MLNQIGSLIAQKLVSQQTPSNLPPVASSVSVEATPNTANATVAQASTNAEELQKYVRSVAPEAIKDAQAYKQQVVALQPAMESAIRNIQKSTAEAKDQLAAYEKAGVEQINTQAQMAKSIATSNQTSQNELAQFLQDPTRLKSKLTANEALNLASQRLAEAQLQSMNGGILDTIVGAFKTDYYSDQVQTANSNFQNIQRTEAQAIQGYLQNVQANLQQGQDAFAGELADATARSEAAKLVLSAREKGVALSGQEMEALASTLGISKERLTANREIMNTLTNVAQADSAVLSNLFSGLQYEEATLRLADYKKKIKNEAEFDSIMEEKFAQFAEAAGLQGSGLTYKNLIEQAKTEGRAPAQLQRFTLWNDFNTKQAGEPVSKVLASITAGVPANDAYSVKVKESIPQYMNEKEAQVRAQVTAEALNNKSLTLDNGKELNQQGRQAVDLKVAEEMKKWQLLNDDGTVNFKAAADADQWFSDQTKKLNADTGEGINRGLVTAVRLKEMIKDPNIMQAAGLDEETIAFIQSGEADKLLYDLRPEGEVGKQVVSNFEAIASSVTDAVLTNNKESSDWARKAAKTMAAAYRVNRKSQQPLFPDWKETNVTVQSLGSRSTLNLEFEGGLQTMLETAMVKERMKRQAAGRALSIGTTPGGIL